jgi:signal transduction histidine kinase
MRRRWVWLQLVIGWLPVWALYTTLIVSAHPDSRFIFAAFVSVRAVFSAAILGVVVHRLSRRLPWPHPMRISFLAIHIVAAVVFAISWMLLTSLIESAIRGRHVIVASPYGITPYLILGIWLYVMVTGVVYASQAAERASRAEAIAARSQLAALRAQLNPHFLFNALHTVVQLIPLDPKQASHAAEQLAALLRVTLEQDRDVVSLAEEWSFVEKYLEIEAMRFGDRLRIKAEMNDSARNASLPSFALQTLVENAVRHGAAPRVDATEISIGARIVDDVLQVTVADTGSGMNPGANGNGGSGLQRLRDRLAVMYGGRASLETMSPAQGGFIASLTIPQDGA